MAVGQGSAWVDANLQNHNSPSGISAVGIRTSHYRHQARPCSAEYEMAMANSGLCSLTRLKVHRKILCTGVLLHHRLWHADWLLSIHWFILPLHIGVCGPGCWRGKHCAALWPHLQVWTWLRWHCPMHNSHVSLLAAHPASLQTLLCYALINCVLLHESSWQSCAELL